MIDIILYGCAFLLSSIPVCIGIMFVGYTAVLIKREWVKTPEQVQAEKTAKAQKR